MRADPRDRRAERWGLWTANLVAVTVVPFTLGGTWRAPVGFAVYVGVAALALMLAEDGALWRQLRTRPDVRAYLRVRLALVALGALPPFVIGACG
jgi:hypothetical protein